MNATLLLLGLLCGMPPGDDQQAQPAAVQAMVIDEAGRAVPGAVVFRYAYSTAGALDPHLPQKSDDDGKLTFPRSSRPQLVGAFGVAQDGPSTPAALHVLPSDAGEVTLKLLPMAKVTGRVLDRDLDAPAANRQVKATIYLQYSLTQRPLNNFYCTATTDETGHFEIEGLIPGLVYYLTVETKPERPGPDPVFHEMDRLEPAPGETIALGEVALPKSQTTLEIEASVVQVFRRQDELQSRMVKLRDHCRDARQKMLLVSGDPKSKEIFQLFRMRHRFNQSADSLQQALMNYIVLGKRAEDVKAQISIIDADGETVATKQLSDFQKDGELDEFAVQTFLSAHCETFPDAREHLDQALAIAARTDRRVLADFGGPFCVPCIRLAKFLDEQRERLSEDYLIVHFDARMPGFKEVHQRMADPRHGNDHSPPISPSMAILSADGTLLTTSVERMRDFGSVHQPDGMAHFRRMLEATRQRLSDETLQAVTSSAK